MTSSHEQNTTTDNSTAEAPSAAPPPVEPASASTAPAEAPPTPQRMREQQREAVRWWLKLVLQPTIFFGLVVLLIVLVGVAQHYEMLSIDGGTKTDASNGGGSNRYICPMMCVPAQSEPGRCPVCSMELKLATSGANETSTSIEIDPTARRIANIQTAPVHQAPLRRTIRTIGELTYDEGALKTLAAYVDGRIEALYADYTGVGVKKGDRLALVYSPRLYSAQVEFLLARKSYRDGRSSTLKGVAESNRRLYDGARQRLAEFGMTPDQITQLEQEGTANSRLHLVAPISGTVIEKQAVEGQYVKEGQTIYRLADLSTLWLMLKLFPDEAATVRYGQKVTATVQSFPNQEFPGRVAFVDPHVDPKTRTVNVRVVIPNRDGMLRVGDYAKAAVEVPIGSGKGPPARVYDPDLAGKWVSPRHPQIVRDGPGTCPLCGIDLVPATEYGFTDSPLVDPEALVVPRDAVLMAGDSSVVYVEVESGKFELRRVVLGANLGNELVVLEGLDEGEEVATRGNFLIDSQMQLVGNPSLIDPSRATQTNDDELPVEVLEALANLPEGDRQTATVQRICPVSGELLGSMGTPIKVDVKGTPVFICCDGCRGSLLNDPEKYLQELEDIRGEETNAWAMDIPPIGTVEIIELEEGSQDGGLPPIGVPELIDPAVDSPGASPPDVRANGTSAETVIGSGREVSR